MTNYNIYIKSNEHPRTINTPMNGRTNWTKITVQGKEALKNKVAELTRDGAIITDIRTDLGTHVMV